MAEIIRSKAPGAPRSVRRGFLGVALLLLALAIGTWLGLGMASSVGRLLFATIGNAAVALVMLVNPLAGMLLWVTAIPFSRYVLLDIPVDNVPDITLLRIGAAVLVFVLLAQAAARKSRLIWHPLDLMFALAAMGIGLSLLDAVSKGEAASIFLNSFLVPFIAYFASRRLVTGRKEMRAVLSTVVGMALLLVLIAMTEFWGDVVIFDPGPWAMRFYSPHLRRLVSLLGNPVFFGVIFCMAAPFLLYFLNTTKSRSAKLMFWAFFIAILVGTYITYVRAAWLGFLVAVMVSAITNSEARKVAAMLGVVAVLLLTVGWATLQGSQLFQERIADEGPIESRLVLYATTIRMVDNNPLRGIGFANFKYTKHKYLAAWGNLPGSIGRLEVTPHNTFLWVLVHSGLLGFTPFVLAILGVVLVTLRRASQLRRRSRDHWLLLGSFWGAWTAFVVNASFADMEFSSFVMTLFFVICGSVLGLVDHSGNRSTIRDVA